MGPADNRQTTGIAPPDDWLTVSEGELEERQRRLAERDAHAVSLAKSLENPANGQPEFSDHPPRQIVSKLDNVSQLAESLDPVDRLRLISRLWASLPRETWPRLGDSELTAARRRLMESEVRWNEPVPWPVVERLLVDRFTPRIYSVPRRFDLATVYIVILAYSLLFALMTSLQFPPAASLAAGGFITIVGVAQAALLGGIRPRAASIWTGAVLYCIPELAGLIGAGPLPFAAGVSLLYLGMQVIIGGLFGYLAGTCVGGVFLLADVVRRKFRHGDEPADCVSTRLVDQPATDRYANVIESPPPNSLWQFLFDPEDASKLFSAPRRFDLATIFVITAALSLLFGFLSVVDRALELGLQPGMTILAGGLLTAVAIGQSWFFGQANPRGVSVIVGVITLTFFTIILSWVHPRMFLTPFLLVGGVIGGAFLGYVAGVLVGGMFLIAVAVRRKFSPTVTDEDEDPFAEADQPLADGNNDVEPAVSGTKLH